MASCSWSAAGDYTCGHAAAAAAATKEGFFGDPNSYPECLRTGCAAGKPCMSASDCQNGLYCACPDGGAACKTGKTCARGNPFTAGALRRARAEGDKQAVADAERLRAEQAYAAQVRAGRRPDAQDNHAIPDQPPPPARHAGCAVM